MLRSQPSPLAQRLLRVATDGSPVARELFLASLMRDADDATVPTLEAALASGDARLQGLAVEALGAVGGPQVIPPLKRALLGRDLELRRSAAAALCRAGALSVLDLCDALQHVDWDIRARAAEALGDIRDARAVGPLCRRLQDPHELVRLRSVRALAEIRDARAAEPLFLALSEALEAMRHTWNRDPLDPREPSLKSPCSLAKTAGQALLDLGCMPTEAQPRLQVLCALLTEQWERLLSLRGAAVEPLCHWLASKDPELELRAAAGLQYLARRQPTPELAAATRILRQRLRASGREPYRAALREIERSVGRAHNLPLPSAETAPKAAGLPRPAEPGQPSVAGLPGPAVVPGPANSAAGGWWSGLRRWAGWMGR